MTFTEDDAGVTLRMTLPEWQFLLRTLGLVTGDVLETEGSGKRFWAFVKLANKLNEGNPNFQPYQIPKEFQ